MNEIEYEIIEINDKQYKKYVSNNGFYIQKVGTEEIYEEAIDIMDNNYEYMETDIEIEGDTRLITSTITPSAGVSTVFDNIVKKRGNIVEIYYAGITTTAFSNQDKKIGTIPVDFRLDKKIITSNAVSTGTSQWNVQNNSYAYVDNIDGSISVKGSGTYFTMNMIYII